MAEQITTTQNEEQRAHDVTLRALTVGLSRYAQWQSLKAAAEQAGYALPDALVAANEQCDRDYLTLARAALALEKGAARLQPWRVGTGPIKLGVAKVSSSLGQWQPVAVNVLKFATKAAIATGGFYLLDLFGGAAKVESEAQKQRAQNTATCQQTAQQLLQAGYAEQAAGVARACANADNEAAKPSPGWWQGIKDSFSNVGDAITTGAAVGTGALIFVGALYLLSRRKKSRSYQLQSPMQFHKPVSFRRPYRAA